MKEPEVVANDWREWFRTKPVVSEFTIGLSLAQCILFIAESKEDILSKVQWLVTDLVTKTPEDWEKVISKYRAGIWIEHPNFCEVILREYLYKGRVYQPKLDTRLGVFSECYIVAPIGETPVIWGTYPVLSEWVVKF